MASKMMSFMLRPLLGSQTSSSPAQSLTDLIQGVKKPPGCTTCGPKTLNLPSLGLQGKGIQVADAVIVTADGSGDFLTIQKAVDSAPTNLTNSYFVIYSKAGKYDEHINIPKEKTNLLLLGDGIDSTVITGNKSVASGLKMPDTASFSVFGAGFVAMNVTFENTFGQGFQALAIRNESDRSAFYKCSFRGYQDTLYANSGKQFYRECDVSGTVDFIFGDATAVFQKCRVLARSPVGATVVITAQQRQNIDGPTGTSIHNCTIMAAEAGVEKNSVFLGRPWADHSRVVYMQSQMSEIIDPLGWMPWPNEPDRANTVSYAEYGNCGAGAPTKDKPRIGWKGVTFIKDLADALEAESFTVGAFIDGGSWLPASDIPFDLGLYPPCTQ